MRDRWVVSAVATLVVAAICLGNASPSSGALVLKSCPPSVSVAAEGDLRVEVDRRRFAFSGRVTSVDADTLARELRRVVNRRGELNGRTVCLTLSRTPGEATYIDDSIPEVVRVLATISGNATFRAMWGGGGLTVVGWMHRVDLDRMKTLAATFPVDVGVVGVVEDLPAKVRVRMERLRLSSSRFAQIEQFHPKAGVITLSTTSSVALQACPGGWRGDTPATVWRSPACVVFDASSAAILPDPGNDFTHLSVAVRPVRGTVDAIDLDLRYSAVDPSFECYIGGRVDPCTLFPPRLAN
jgi:hypothetical protein